MLPKTNDPELKDEITKLTLVVKEEDLQHRIEVLEKSDTCYHWKDSKDAINKEIQWVVQRRNTRRSESTAGKTYPINKKIGT